MTSLAVPTPERPDLGAWYRFDPRLDPRGVVVGRTLALGRGSSELMLKLDAEATASGPVGSAVLVASDDGHRSAIAIVDAGRGCVVRVGGSRSIVRRAVLDPAASSILEHRVDRVTRASLGIWRRPLDGTPEALVIDPIPDDVRFGRTFTTELAWSDGGRIVVQSCGEAACRTRVVDAVRGVVTSQSVDDPDQGELIALSGETLVTYAACPQLPCAIVATDLATGSRRTLADRAGFATVLKRPGAPTIVHEVDQPGSGSLRTVPLDDRAPGTIDVEPGQMLAAPSTRSGSARVVPAGWLLLTRDGYAGRSTGLAVVDPVTGMQQSFREVTR